MATIFINYRRSDSSGYSRGLYERLANTFGVISIFYDVDDIPGGEDFVQWIKKNLEDCRVVLVMIGPNWLKVTNEDGTRRLDDQDDRVRGEIELAMQKNLPIIPVLVGGSVMPKAHQLPPSITPLATRNALIVSETDFSNDMERLVGTIQGICGIASGQRQSPGKKKGFSGMSFILGGIVVTVVVGGFIFLIIVLASLSSETANNTVINNTLLNVSPSPTSKPRAEPTVEGKRIQFAPGEYTATISGTIARGKEEIYIVGARTDQKMEIYIESPQGNATFSVTDPTGKYRVEAVKSEEETGWTGVLPSTGDYKIVVVSTRGTAKYTLAVAIE